MRNKKIMQQSRIGSPIKRHAQETDAPGHARLLYDSLLYPNLSSNTGAIRLSIGA